MLTTTSDSEGSTDGVVSPGLLGGNGIYSDQIAKRNCEDENQEIEVEEMPASP